MRLPFLRESQMIRGEITHLVLQAICACKLMQYARVLQRYFSIFAVHYLSSSQTVRSCSKVDAVCEAQAKLLTQHKRLFYHMLAMIAKGIPATSCFSEIRLLASVRSPSVTT